MRTFNVGLLGATGMVGQRFITLLESHPWFRVTAVAASSRSAGKFYAEAVGERWVMEAPIPTSVASLPVLEVHDLDSISERVDFVFSALDMEKEAIQQLENAYAERGIPVVSNNSAHRWTDDVPMIIPEVNPHHLSLIDRQRRNRGWDKGFIVVKPNCSLQSYLPLLPPLEMYGPERLFVTTMQAISGSGRLLEAAPEIKDNVIPLKGEEEKSETEPLKILGELTETGIRLHPNLKISAHCNRVACEDGHMAVISLGFRKKPSREAILEAWNQWIPLPQQLKLPSAPSPFLIYRDEEDRPQTRLDRDAGRGMALTVGRLRECNLLDFRMMALSHNTIRGAAGGAILTAELLAAQGYL